MLVVFVVLVVDEVVLVDEVVEDVVEVLDVDEVDIPAAAHPQNVRNRRRHRAFAWGDEFFREFFTRPESDERDRYFLLWNIARQPDQIARELDQQNLLAHFEGVRAD